MAAINGLRWSGITLKNYEEFGMSQNQSLRGSKNLR